ncbi:hypothetical protein ACFL59_13425, partial [Planctomycetota bacterium]
MTRTETRTTKRRRSPRTSEQPPSDAPFPYHDYEQARRLLLAAVQRGPFYGLVTGASGTGKTSLKDDVRSGLDPHRHQLLYRMFQRIARSAYEDNLLS